MGNKSSKGSKSTSQKQDEIDQFIHFPYVLNPKTADANDNNNQLPALIEFYQNYYYH